ncbi:unnamed protein product [Rangifer tarandus platyrhynchus]|uniref:Uncharacterized protein n=1 Tax=Rangifer tarandus platyrhynchus TaxID=3082113 RepID=A0ABN8Y4T0_RANTA|nr:unnamed protein product [Rangifer tarandus platyrhynchus]
MLMPFQTHGEEISPALRSHAIGLSEAGGVQKGVGDSQNLLSGEAWGGNTPQGWKCRAQDWKWRPPSSLTSAVTLDVSDGKTACAFPEMLGRHLIRREHSLGPLRPQNHAAF